MQADSVAIVVTAVGKQLPGYCRWTLPFIAAYCARHGYRLEILHLPPDDKRNASWQKLLAFHAIPESVSTAVLIDMDVMPMPWAGPIHESLSGTEISMCQHGDVWQCGVIGLPRCKREWAENIYRCGDWGSTGNWFEQTDVNRSLNSGDETCNKMHGKWNHIPGRMFRPRLLEPNGVQFLHCAGLSRRHKKAGRLEAAWKLLSPQLFQ